MALIASQELQSVWNGHRCFGCRAPKCIGARERGGIGDYPAAPVSKSQGESTKRIPGPVHGKRILDLGGADPHPDTGTLNTIVKGA